MRVAESRCFPLGFTGESRLSIAGRLDERRLADVDVPLWLCDPKRIGWVMNIIHILYIYISWIIHIINVSDIKFVIFSYEIFLVYPGVRFLQKISPQFLGRPCHPRAEDAPGRWRIGAFYHSIWGYHSYTYIFIYTYYIYILYFFI